MIHLSLISCFAYTCEAEAFKFNYDKQSISKVVNFDAVSTEPYDMYKASCTVDPSTF